MKMRMAILLCVACPALQNFSTLSHKRHEFRGGKNVVEHKICFRFSLQLLSETFLFVTRTERDIVTNGNRFSCTVPGILVIF